MKTCIAVVVASFLASIVMIAPATAQKDPACMEKCTRSNVGHEPPHPRHPGRGFFLAALTSPRQSIWGE
jgi:hypothetical protein